MAKTWHEKFNNGRDPVVEILDKPFGAIPVGGRLLISSPREIKELIDGIPLGQSKSPIEIREALATRHSADATCPLTTGIFLRIIAEVALLDMGSGQSEITPFWRVIEPKSPLAKKLSCGPDFIRERRAAEGI